jgi:hypothetical protein
LHTDWSKVLQKFLLVIAACALSAPTTWAQAPALSENGAQAPVPTGRQGRGAQAPGAQSIPRYVPADPIDFDDHQDWIQMFDGKTLQKWDGPMDLWRVENGAIVVQSKADPPTGSVYLLWRGGEPKDFEFKWEVKLDGAGANSGVQFRATKLVEVGNSRLSSRLRQSEQQHGRAHRVLLGGKSKRREAASRPCVPRAGGPCCGCGWPDAKASRDVRRS